MPIGSTNPKGPKVSSLPSATGRSGRVNLTPNLPPELHTLVYSPDAMISIGHGGMQYDVSNDIVRVAVERVEDGASSLQFTLANWGQRYDRLFTPMDTVICLLKRVEFLQVFAGYLDTAHLIQLYPGTADFAATCTLKRIIHTWWDPSLPASIQLFAAAQIDSLVSGDGKGSPDSGLGNLLRKLLTEVGGWPQQNIHIQQFPQIFFQFMSQQLNQMISHNNQQTAAFDRLLLGDDITSGQGAVSASTQSGAMTGGYSPSQAIGGALAPALGAAGAGQAYYVQQIIQACDQRSLGPQTSNLVTAVGVQKASGESQDPKDKQAWQQVQGVGQTMQKTELNSDAAILGVACCLQESSLRMLANYAVPDSLNYPHDDTGSDGTSIGLFQQQNGGWGSVAQRMNALASAGMFFNKLAAFDWRNMDPGAAIQKVQISAFPGAYTQHIPQATQLVQAARNATGTNPMMNPQVLAAEGSPIGLVPNMSAPISNGGGLLGGQSGSMPGTSLVGAGSVNKPNPDSEGAVQWAMSQLGTPYSQNNPQVPRQGLDCSGLCELAYRSIGLEIGRTTWHQADPGHRIPASNIQRGDLIQPNTGHTVMYLGGGMIIEEPDFGQVCKTANYASEYGSLANASGIYHWAENGGASPTAIFNTSDPTGNLPGQPAGTQQISVHGTGSAGGASEPIARNLFSFMFQPSVFASQTHQLFDGEKSFINGQSLMQIIQAVTSAGLRSFCSAPNGDFVAYYPDWFGLDGGLATMNIEDIECIDIRLNLSDDPLTTHVYVAGDETGVGTTISVNGWLDTAGVATVEDEWLYQRMIKIAPDLSEQLGGADMLYKYGVRPFIREFASVRSHALEFFLAVKIFMLKWAEQYKTTVRFTFMPELFPEMRLNFVGHNLQVYVTSVRHSGDFENGFFTEADIMAPSNPNAKGLMNSVPGPINPNKTNNPANVKPPTVVMSV